MAGRRVARSARRWVHRGCRPARRRRASTGRWARSTARPGGAIRRIRPLGSLRGLRGHLAAARDVGSDDSLVPVRGGRGRSRADGTRRGRRRGDLPPTSGTCGHRLPLGRVAGAGRGHRRLPRVHAGGQVRDRDGLPVPFGGDRGAGRRGPRAARAAVAPVPRRRRGRARCLAAGVVRPDGTLAVRPRRRTCAR